jgi:hypothetical protein
MIPSMSDQECGDGQRRDKLLLRLLKTPPQPRPKRERGKRAAKADRRRGERASEGKRAPSS